MQIETNYSCNSVIWITGVADAEMGPSKRMIEDLEQLSQSSSNSICFEWKKVDQVSELICALTKLADLAHRHHLRPIVVLDMHGDADNGLLLSSSGELLSWARLGEALRELNIATGNNLCVIGAACHSLSAITPVMLAHPTPFFILLAAREEVSVGFLETAIPAFFERLFHTGSIDDAYQTHLSDKFGYFHCEQMLVVAMTRYIKQGCIGRLGKYRRDRLLTEALGSGIVNTRESRRTIRKAIKRGTKPDQALLDRYADTFLIGRPCSVKMVDLLKLAREQKHFRRTN